jgi:hypothetical protein
MQASDLFFYISLGLGLLVLYMIKPEKPKHPTPLKMKGFSPQQNYKDKQLPGAKPVKADLLSEDQESEETLAANWASPTIVVEGKPKDAYAILNLESGVPLEQVKSQVAYLLQQKNSPIKVDLIKRAYQAIVDAYIS